MESVGVIFSSWIIAGKLLTVMFLIMLLSPEFKVFCVMCHHSPKRSLFWQKQTNHLQFPECTGLCLTSVLWHLLLFLA